MDTATQLKWLAAVVGLVGLWLIVGPPFLFEAPFADFWNDLLVGLALVALAAYTYARSGNSSSRWSAAAGVVLGAWLVVGAVLWQTSQFLHWNDVVAGIVVFVVAGYGAYESHKAYSSSDDSDDGSDNGSTDDSDGDSDDGSNNESSDDSDGE
jgi:drug/metabolite transporter (DMT)-like permease